MKTPRLLHDLYSDLRDRKLLPLVIILPLAMLAVPLLLKQDTAPPPTTVAEAPVPEGAPTAAVLAASPTLREYRERLDDLRAKNPFAGEAEEAEDSPEVGTVGGTSATGASTTGSETGGEAGGSQFSETFSETVNESTSTESTTTDVSVSSGDDAGDGGNGSDSDAGSRWFTYSVDVLTGPAGDTRRRNNLQNLTVLPSKSNPVAVYLGVTDGGKKAAFMLSPDVVGNSGDGFCTPSPSQCQFLELRQGEEQKLDYAPGGEPDTYVLDVKDIRLEQIEDPRDKAVGGDPKDTREGLSAFAGD